MKDKLINIMERLIIPQFESELSGFEEAAEEIEAMVNSRNCGNCKHCKPTRYPEFFECDATLAKESGLYFTILNKIVCTTNNWEAKQLPELPKEAK